MHIFQLIIEEFVLKADKNFHKYFVSNSKQTHGQSCYLTPLSTIFPPNKTTPPQPGQADALLYFCFFFFLKSLHIRVFLVPVLEATFYVPSPNLPAKRCHIIIPLCNYHIYIMEGQHGKLLRQVISSFRHCHLC